ncbi:MAG TPA: DEAD/DEAH box helicase [Candidatus Nanoarchaeia archaeon]|nr:DEAD/DEAH box helicase [Candidatus Nanoarchaeia archaeon]
MLETAVYRNSKSISFYTKTMESFKKLGLSEQLLKSFADAGFEKPSEIQELVIPLALAGKDVIGCASTGSGKTLAFGAHILEKIKDNKGKGVQALIITPTRELAEQVSHSLTRFSKYMGIKVAAIYGGVSYGPQIYALRHADIIVGTPGRLLDHIHERTFDMRNLKNLVLDEADRMFDMGFIKDVVEIIEACPKERQTLLLSATMSRDIVDLAQEYMNKPVEVGAEEQVDPSKLKQVFYDAMKETKFSLLVHLLKQEHEGLIMVFCNTRRNADFIAKNLKRYGMDAQAIHGGLSQNKRNSTIYNFSSKHTQVLVCTDVAARGLDIKGVSHVYNYDIPKNSKEYIHRIGRTARAGENGMAINIVTKYDYQNFRAVLSDEAINIERLEVPQFEQVQVSFNSSERGRGGGYSGGRGRFGGGSHRGHDRRDSGRGDYREGRFGGRRDSRSSARHERRERRY